MIQKITLYFILGAICGALAIWGTRRDLKQRDLIQKTSLAGALAALCLGFLYMSAYGESVPGELASRRSLLGLAIMLLVAGFELAIYSRYSDRKQ